MPMNWAPVVQYQGPTYNPGDYLGGGGSNYDGPSWYIGPGGPGGGDPLGGGGTGDWTPPWGGGGGGNGGPLGGPVGDAVEWLGGVLDYFGVSWGDVGSWLSPLFSGGPNAPATGTKEEKAAALEQTFKQSSSLREAFITFLRNAGATISWINNFINNPIPSWPIFLIDLALFWLQKGAPATAGSPGFSETATLWNQQFGGGSNLPLPGGGMTDFSLLAGTALMNPVVQATPTMVYKAPKGYVTVTHPTTGAKLFVEKNLAYRAGLVKRRGRAMITYSEGKTLRTAARVEEKIARLSKKSFNKYKCVRK